MVQPGQGLRVHNPRRRWRGPLRALLRHTGQRVQEPRGGREDHLRGGPGPEGSAGPKRLQGVSASSAAAHTDLMPGSFGASALYMPRDQLIEGWRSLARIYTNVLPGKLNKVVVQS